MTLKGIIFDLDGTLVDSQLDFAAMRDEMELAPGLPILEALQAMPPGPNRDRCWDILERHEREGAAVATLIPGVSEFFQTLSRRGLRRAIVTRNSSSAASVVVERLGLDAWPLLTRDDDMPPKPDPTGLVTVCREWQVSHQDVLFFGDFRFDLQAGQAAGIRTVLYAPELPEYADEADYVIRHFREAGDLVARLAD